MHSRDHDSFTCEPVMERKNLHGQFRLVEKEKWRVRKRYKNLELISNAVNKVCKATDTYLQKDVAIKRVIYAFSDESHARKYCRELYLLPRLSHPNVIKVLDAFSDVDLDQNPEDMTELFLAMPFADLDLHQYMMRLMQQSAPVSCPTTCDLTGDQVNTIMFQILHALKYLHSNGLMHRDLNSSNVGLSPDGTVLLLDFDFSRHVNDRNKEGHSILIANQNYRAPEVMLTPGFYEKKVDIWSAGCIFAELLTVSNGLRSRDPLSKQFLRVPDTSGPIQYFHELLKVLGSPPESFFNSLPRQEKEFFNEQISSMAKAHQEDPLFESRYSFVESSAKDLLKQLLMFDPNKRLSAHDALKHKYFDYDYESASIMDSEDPNNNNNNNNEPTTSFVCPVDVFSDKPATASEIKNLVFAELHNFP